MLRRCLSFGSILLLSACTLSPGGLSEKQVGSALPTAGELGREWQLVGTTTQRPAEASWDDALTDASAEDPACRTALLALEEALVTPEPARFARSVYRNPTQGANADRDLTVTVETFDAPPDRPAAVRAMTEACTEPMRTRAGIRTVTMTVTEHDDSNANTAGYSVTYNTDGLRYSFDYVLARRTHAVVAASVTGPSSSANQRLLRQAVELTGTNLDRAGGTQPTP
ncbi:hypothetical protein BJY21_002630 [Kineosphaera limosa]|uniref:PknH-like extracellular domain-containing protein n=1 Tax=Kineosphaera limosa NBRC 100340 TaxID=1184609 RepID=K6VG83_9MICO|nr:sensor domain-containing protein [Kineosphaera limosa]NYE01446.1 hypothetical protein [Kineosphaera limosa]GAB95193.1 hypothetical protein KILIM_017_00380 [Kineosphaera limosa NBRC 100340]